MRRYDTQFRYWSWPVLMWLQTSPGRRNCGSRRRLSCAVRCSCWKITSSSSITSRPPSQLQRRLRQRQRWSTTAPRTSAPDASPSKISSATCRCWRPEDPRTSWNVSRRLMMVYAGACGQRTMNRCRTSHPHRTDLLNSGPTPLALRFLFIRPFTDTTEGEAESSKNPLLY